MLSSSYMEISSIVSGKISLKRRRAEHLCPTQDGELLLMLSLEEEILVFDALELFAEVFPLRDIERTARLSLRFFIDFHPSRAG